MLIAEISVSINSENIDKPFSYIVPEDMAAGLKKGCRVIVPFGKSNKPVEGFVLDIKEKEISGFSVELKSIKEMSNKAPLINADLMELAFWMKEKYYSTLAECIKCILPAGISIKTETLYYLNNVINSDLDSVEEAIVNFMALHSPITAKAIKASVKGAGDSHIRALVKKNVLTKDIVTAGKDFLLFERRAAVVENISAGKVIPSGKTKQGLVFKYLLENGETPVKKIKEALNITESPIQALSQKGLINIRNVEIRRQAPVKGDTGCGFVPVLNAEQTEALNTVLEMMKAENKKPILLHGVTGSGKTEIYIKAIEETLKEGRQAIVLVPEISLTPQTVGRFKDRFGQKVSVTHSRMTMAERFDQWKNAAEGSISVMIGPRSALFTPFNNLGIIVIDEEHENTYKSETTPKYDAKLAAIERARITGAICLLGSATPSMESYHKALSGEYVLAKMKNRINLSMPSVEIVDMRKELDAGNRSMFSTKLMDAVMDSLQNNMQIILFLNRRGHSTFVSCRQCGYVVKCEDCNVNFTYHIYNDSLMCHYCGKTSPSPKNCPQCGSKYIKYFGVGTQKVEEEISRVFPGASVLRMDMDTTGKKGSHENILSGFRAGKAQILVGTQMIAKGLDFPRVTLVGVIAADLSLNTGDYRAAETTFQLLTQVSGRSGRAENPGKVIIQTYTPEHYSIIHSANGDYEGFFEHEAALRRQMNYPPYSHIFTVVFTGESEKKVIALLFKLCDIMGMYNKNNSFELVGPSPAVISKIKGNYRWRLTVKAKDESRLRNYVIYCVDKLKISENLSDINISLSLDPAVSV